jgi:hypothetical protein
MSRTTVLACATVIEEMVPHLPPEVHHQVFDFGLHTDPDKLRAALQEAIDAASTEADTIILGYGLCSNAVMGLRATDCRLVVPRVHDCIALFLGSCAAYDRQAQQEPGTYYLTKGWIAVGDTPFSEYDQLVERRGKDKADRMYQLMFQHYTRLAFIDTGHVDQERYREYARDTAARFGLRYEEIPGSDELIKRTLFGPWDGDFVVVEPGEEITMGHFAPLLMGGHAAAQR